jgi:cyclophilin family peptidyl-prolyl cis-trans isomerase/FKBP-type peptidyl-prolyl cis-trans isomerase
MTAFSFRKPAGLMALVASLFASAAFAQDAKPAAAPGTAPAPAPSAPAPGEKFINVKMTTNFGDIILELNNEKAPISTANFLAYTDKGFYNNTLFHRVMPNFMIQGGGYGIGLIEKPDTLPPIKNEWVNGLSNLRGTISMARTMMPDSATCQFFINTVDNPRLDGEGGQAGYAVFGKVVAGMGVVDAIKGVPTANNPTIGGQPSPVAPVVIEKVERVPAAGLEEAKKAADASAAKGVAELNRRNEEKKAIEDAAKQRIAEQGKALGTDDEQFAKAMDWLKAKGVDVSQGTKSASGLWSVVIKAGEGASPVPEDTVKVKYAGYLVNGNLFDSSEEYSLQLKRFVPGWIEGFSAMKTGGHSWLVIPGKLGYGERGYPPVIPPNATMIFDVELLEVVGK